MPKSKPTRKEHRPVPLGWCLDGLHDKCIKVTPITHIECVCTCHTKE